MASADSWLTWATQQRVASRQRARERRELYRSLQLEASSASHTGHVQMDRVQTPSTSTVSEAATRSESSSAQCIPAVNESKRQEKVSKSQQCAQNPVCCSSSPAEVPSTPALTTMPHAASAVAAPKSGPVEAVCTPSRIAEFAILPACVAAKAPMPPAPEAGNTPVVGQDRHGHDGNIAMECAPSHDGPCDDASADDVAQLNLPNDLPDANAPQSPDRLSYARALSAALCEVGERPQPDAWCLLLARF